jgi:predicted acyl esterase
MRDGVVLRADLTLPAGVDRAPVILIRQPYGRKTPAMMLDQTASFWRAKAMPAWSRTCAASSPPTANSSRSSTR